MGWVSGKSWKAPEGSSVKAPSTITSTVVLPEPVTQ